MDMYVSRLKNIELEALIATYDIPLDLRPRLPDPNFRMINLPVRDTAIGIYSMIFDSLGVRIPFSSFLLAVLKYFKVHISQLVPLGLSKVITFENHVDQQKAHIVKLRDIPEGVLVRSGLSRVWRNPMCDPVLRLMSIYDFLFLPSLDKIMVREEPHELGTSILGRVVDRTTSPAPAGIAIPRASPKEIVITRPDPKKVSRAGSSRLAARDGIKKTDDGTLDDDDQRNGSEFAMEDIRDLNDVSQDKEVEAHAELFGGVRRTTRTNSYASHDTDAGADAIASDGNVDPYFDDRVSNTTGDVLERGLLPFILGAYYIPYPFDEGSVSESPPYTRDDWEEIHRVNLGLRQKELYKDPKVCRNALDLFPTPAETHRLRELSSVELSDQMSTWIIKKKGADLKQQKESTVRANEEVSRLTAELGVLKSRCLTVEHKLSSWDKNHRKYRNERDTLSIKKAKIEEELVGTKFLKSSEFNRAFAGVLNTTIGVGVEHGLRMDQTDEEFRGLSQKVVGFIPDAKEKFDRVIVAFPNTTFPFLDMVSQHSQSSLQDIARLEPDRGTYSHQHSFATMSLRDNTHVRHSTSSSRTFGHTSTLEHLKKKRKSVEKGGPLAA
ncbi:hypothetical protein Tco_1410173 [Tanacetum coccineum]